MTATVLSPNEVERLLTNPLPDDYPLFEPRVIPLDEDEDLVLTNTHCNTCHVLVAPLSRPLNSCEWCNTVFCDEHAPRKVRFDVIPDDWDEEGNADEEFDLCEKCEKEGKEEVEAFLNRDNVAG